MNDNDRIIIDNILNRLDKIEGSIKKLNESIVLLSNKEMILNTSRECQRLLSYQYKTLLKELKKEIDKHDPSKQINIRKVLLNNIPERSTYIDNFLKTVYEIFDKYKLNYNKAEVEIWLRKIGLVIDNKIKRSNLPEKDFNVIYNAL